VKDPDRQRPRCQVVAGRVECMPSITNYQRWTGDVEELRVEILCEGYRTFVEKYNARRMASCAVSLQGRGRNDQQCPEDLGDVE
jgi:hypothetical protein